MTARPAAPPPPAPTKEQGRSPRMTLPAVVNLNDITSGIEEGPDRILLYGTGGIGKSTLAAFLPAPLFIDLQDGTRRLPVTRTKADSWPMLRGKLASIATNPPKGVRSVVIDTTTDAEELNKDFVVETRKTEKGKAVDSIEGFGWGKGWQFVYDEFCAMLADLDRIRARGIIVCNIAHVITSPVPNPDGEDFLRYEPLLYSGDKKGRGSVRDLMKNWSDHVLFIGYDVDVADGKGKGHGSRSIYTYETPTCVAKTRAKALILPYELQDPARIWRELDILK